ncbi:MAG: phosphoglycerol transferase MdoB-like AlkP superfamily enzyme [Parasphingorhabdus sp.]|jgi:phosphoglycerol transferase MdoB-like AlkP superfamily enzyme
MDRKFLMIGFGYAILGMCLGIFMAASQNHTQHVTHAHIMLLGFVVSFMYAVCHRLWLGNTTSGLARTQLFLHLVGSLVIAAGLFLLYGGIVAIEILDPILAIGSIVSLIALVLMKVLLIKAFKAGQ